MKYKRSASIVARDVAGEHLLVPVSGAVADMRQLFSLNDSGQEIWDALADTATEDQLVEVLVRKYKADGAAVRRDVRELLGQLVERKLVDAVP